MDVTELSAVRDRYQASRPVAAVLLLDNYEDLMKNLTENQRSTIYSEINARLDAWVDGTGRVLRRMERDRYLFFFEEQYLSRFVDQKFDILDTIHQVVNPGRTVRHPVHRCGQGRLHVSGADAVRQSLH